MDDPNPHHADPQLAEIKQHQTVVSSQSQLGQVIGKDKLEQVDIKHQDRMADNATQFFWLSPTASDVLLLFSKFIWPWHKPRSKADRKRDDRIYDLYMYSIIVTIVAIIAVPTYFLVKAYISK